MTEKEYESLIKQSLENYWKSELEKNTESSHSFSHKYVVRRRKIIRMNKKRYKVKYTAKHAVRVSLMIILMILLMMGATMNATASKRAYNGFKILNSKTFGTVIDTIPLVPEKNIMDYVHSRIDSFFTPKIGSDYSVEYEYKSELLYNVIFENDRGDFIDYSQRLLSTSEYVRDPSFTEEFSHGGIKYVYYEAGKQNYLVWNDFGYSFFVTSNTLDKDELLSLSMTLEQQGEYK